MIAALYRGTTPVEVKDAWTDDQGQSYAHIESLGREVLGDAVVSGGVRNLSRATICKGEDITCAAQIENEDEWDELAALRHAIATTDRRSEEVRFLAPYFRTEDEAHTDVVNYIHEHSLPRAISAREISPNCPPAHLSVWEGLNDKNLHPEALAVLS